MTQKFKQIKVERKFDEFLPDIQLLSADGDKIQDVIFIEIFVTHKCTDKKLKKGKRIIEIKINNEDDILKLRTNKLSVADKQITFYNFKKTTEELDHCSQSEKGCRTLINTFILYKNGAYVFLNESMENTLSQIAAEEGRILKIDFKAFDNYYKGLPYKEKIDDYIDKLVNQGGKIKDCRYCRYQVDKVRKGENAGFFCKFLKKDIEYNTAWDCEFYRLK